MHLLLNLKHTFNSIFDFYLTSGKKYYAFSWKYALTSILVSFIISMLAVEVYEELISTGTHYTISFERYRLYFHYLFTYGYDIMVFHIALYGIFMYRNTGSSDKPSFKLFFAAIPRKTFGLYGAILVLSLVLSVGLQYAANMSRYIWSDGVEGLNSTPNAAMIYTFLIVGFIKLFLPFILAFFLLKSALGEHFVYRKRRSLRTIFLILLILGFAVTLFSNKVVGVGEAIFSALFISWINEGYISLVLTFAVYGCMIAIFYPAIAGAMMFPFTYKEEEHNDLSTHKDDSLIDQPL